MDDKRLIDIETKLAHQEHTVAELNDVLTNQQAQIQRLERQVQALTERVKALSEDAPAAAADDGPPPHY